VKNQLLLVEQTMTGLSAADRAYVLDHGCIVHAETIAELADKRIANVYFGTPSAATALGRRDGRNE
jgi:ABC-type branched-subunit amino acid transport system ATPase component